jgi:hypothetical protein
MLGMSNVFARVFVGSLAAFGVLAGCESSLEGEGGAAGVGGGVIDDNGQTGSPGGIGGGTAGSPPERTCAEYSCAAEFMSHIGSDFAARDEPVVSIVGARCELDLYISDGFEHINPPICACETDDQFSYYVAADPVGCAVRGHTGECLMEHGEIEPCSADDAEHCESVCDELQTRLEVDASMTKAFRVRSARCEEQQLFPDYVTTSCSDAVVEIDGFCYAATPFIDWNRWQSCELSDEEVLSAPPPPLPYCDDIPESVPSTADCRSGCDDASDCRLALGCGYGPASLGYEQSGRGLCLQCRTDENCLTGERCADGVCALEANVECDEDEDCPRGEWCTPVGMSLEGRGNEDLVVKCLPPS